MVSEPGTRSQIALSKTDRPQTDRPQTDRPASQGSPLWRRYVWGLLPIALISLIGGIYYLRSPAQTNLAPTAAVLPVKTIPVEPARYYTLEREYTGELVAGRSSALGFERAGTAVRMLVDEGDRVVAGQPLARLDIRTLEAQRQQLEAQRQEAHAQLRELQAGPRQEDIDAAAAAVAELEQQVALARLQRDRRENLYAEGAISREALDQQTYNAGALENRLAQGQSRLAELQAGTRREQLDAQVARVRQLDARLRQVNVDLQKSVLYAPFGGTIGTRSVDEGAIVSSGQTVLNLVETGPLEARVGVPPAIADTLTVGSKQRLRLRDRTYIGRVTALLPELDTTSRTVTVVLQLPAVDLAIGQTVRLAIAETRESEGFWLPTTALVPRDRGLWSVYVLAEPEASTEVYTVGRREVEALHTEGDRVLVRGTLQAGDLAIASGTHRIVPGEQVRPE